MVELAGWEAHFRNYRHYVSVPSAPWTDYPFSLTKQIRHLICWVVTINIKTSQTISYRATTEFDRKKKTDRKSSLQKMARSHQSVIVKYGKSVRAIKYSRSLEWIRLCSAPDVFVHLHLNYFGLRTGDLRKSCHLLQMGRKYWPTTEFTDSVNFLN